jgi:uncharacterized membrane protein YkvA (DUF1232 family)
MSTGNLRLPADPVHLTPDRLADNERLVRRRFWPKLRAAIGRIPFAEDAVAAFYCATDPATPLHVKAGLLGALAYFILPADMVPDLLAGLGFTDDAAVLLGAVRAVSSHLRPDHYDRARSALAADPDVIRSDAARLDDVP